MNDSKTYIEALYPLIGAISFGSDSKTLASSGVLVKYNKSANDTANTIVHLFRESADTREIESKLNHRTYYITILIRAKATDREEQAQTDLDYLVEKILEVLEVTLRTLDIGNAYIDSSFLESKPVDFKDNYLNEKIVIPIRKRVVVPV